MRRLQELVPRLVFAAVGVGDEGVGEGRERVLVCRLLLGTRGVLQIPNQVAPSSASPPWSFVACLGQPHHPTAAACHRARNHVRYAIAGKDSSLHHCRRPDPDAGPLPHGRSQRVWRPGPFVFTRSTAADDAQLCRLPEAQAKSSIRVFGKSAVATEPTSPISGPSRGYGS